MAVLTRRFATSVGAMKKYREELLKKELPESTRTRVLEIVDKILVDMEIVQIEYKHKYTKDSYSKHLLEN